MDTANLYSTIDSLKYSQQYHSNNKPLQPQALTAHDTWYGTNTNRSIVSACGVEVNRIYGTKTTLGYKADSTVGYRAKTDQQTTLGYSAQSTLGYSAKSDQQNTLGFNTMLMSSDSGYLRFVPMGPQGQNSGSILKTSQYSYRVYDSRRNSVDSRQNSVEGDASINTENSN